MKHNLALCQVNNAYGENIYLPYAVGLLYAHARQFPEIREEWNPPEFLYRKESISKALARLGDPLPDLVAFSCYIWNWEWNRALARAIKEKSPGTTILYGGVHIPDQPKDDWFSEHSEVDFLLHGEAEASFTSFLREFTNERNWEKVAGLSADGIRTKRVLTPLDQMQSPYLDGVFDRLLPQEKRWQVLQESNRGCPFFCTFCEWGAAALNKIRPFPLERVLGEVDWFGRNQVDYMDGADANFGILARDEQIAEAIIKAKEKYGSPEKFRTSFAKYTNDTIAERIFRIAKGLHRSGQLKAVTLALQSTHEETLDLIRRKNIAMDHFATLQNRYRAEDIPTYTELILGLPGETFGTFCQGIDRILDSGQHEGFFAYTCTLLPNSEMGHPDYIERHGIESVRMRSMLTHGTPTPDVPDEYQWTVVGTKSMPHQEWKRTYMLAWTVQVLHSFGLTRWWAMQEREQGVLYSVFYKAMLKIAECRPETALGRVYTHTIGLLDRALVGGSWDNVLPEFSDISWPSDEGGMLLLARGVDQFYDEMESIMGMPAEQRQYGPPAIPSGREKEYARGVWYGRKGNMLEGLRKQFSREVVLLTPKEGPTHG